MNSQTVIITDGNQRAALAVVRSLGKAGFRCVVASPIRRSLAGVSRFAAREVVVPDALDAPSAFVHALAALSRQENAVLIMPITEPSVLAVLPERQQFAPAVIPLADGETFSTVSDKRRLLQEASALGIAVPQQTVLENAAAAKAFDVSTVTYPVVLKPSRSVGEQDGQRLKVGVSYASDSADLRHRLDQCSPSVFPLLLQQRIVGPGTGVFLLLWNGEIRACFAHRRLLERPPSGGVSVYCESVALDEKVLMQSRALLDRFGWRGVAMVEYKLDRASGTPYLMEVNGRFWGSLQLSIDSGVDFPNLLARVALDLPTQPAATFRVGTRSRWWWGQVDHVLARIRRPEMRSLPSGTPGMIRTLTHFLLAPLRLGDREEVLRFADPCPFWYETVRWFQGK